MAYSSGSGSSFMYGRVNQGEDTPDILIPPLTPSTSQNRFSNGNGNGQSGSESSDARWFQPSSWKGSRQNHSMQAIQVGAITYLGKHDNLYNMNHPSRGKCLIFNHKVFDKSQKDLTERTGTEVDVNNIRTTFSSFGFTIVEYNNLKYNDIMLRLKSIAGEDHSLNDCLVVFVLTHGKDNQLHAYDVLYKPSDLWSWFTADKCSTLAGKPKMFFIQACRGDHYDDGTELQYQKRARTQADGPRKDENNYRIPNQADFLTVFSTVEGYFAWRNSKSGSCFIQALCKVFTDQCASRDVLSMMTLVNRVIAIQYESHTQSEMDNRKKQTPHVCHTLMREIYLGPKHQSTLV